jgi:luciferase-like monooxygenase
LGAKLGYDAAWVVEHHFSDYYPTPSPLLLLSHIAARCPGFGLGTAVLVTSWHQPLRMAEEIAMLRLLDVGYNYVILIPSIPSVPAALRQDWLTRFARDVMPHFRD